MEEIEIEARFVHYAESGEDMAPPEPLEARIVDDHEHGMVLEIVLPNPEYAIGSKAVFVPVSELKKLAKVIAT